MKAPALYSSIRVFAVLLAAVFLFVFASQELRAQAAAAPAGNLADLSQHREKWPAQLTLKNDVSMVITANGHTAGSFPSPAGSTVSLIEVTPAGVVVGVASARATIPPEQTDLWERVGAAAAPPAVDTATGLPKLPPIATPPLTPTAPAPAMPPPPVIPAPAPTATTPPAQTSGPALQFDVEIPPSGNITKTAFRFWSPAYAQPVRGVIVLVPGLNGDGRGMLNDRNWQTLAQKYRLALVSCFMQGKDYHNAANGTGDALLQAIGQFADKAGHSEIKKAPLLLYGESAGGQFDYSFALLHSERVMAFVVNKGGFYTGADADSRMYAVPGLFFLGMADTQERIDAITGIWTAGRKRGALWALAPQQRSGHEFSKTAAPSRVFFESVLKRRLPDDSLASGDDPPPMKSIDEAQGWLGDLTTHDIRDASTDSNPDRKAAWLPDEDTAKAWKAFVSQ
jgi:pimeloyl-ACP methyl ester carboxylesterase